METTYVSGNDLSLRLRDITINYDDAGQGDIPVIFIHGFPFNKEMWVNQVANLSDHCRVLAYDIRGFGKSEPGIQKYSISLFADDLIEFMDALQIQKAIVCGLSMGGYILLNAVTRFPDRFDSIVLSDTQCIADSPQAREGRMKSIELINKEGVGGFADGFIQKVFWKETFDRNPDAVQKIRTIINSTAPSSVTSTLTALAERDEVCSKLGNINVPALILCGDEDVVTPVEQSKVLQSKIPGAQLQILQEAGHMSNLEQPEAFNRHLMDFIRTRK